MLFYTYDQSAWYLTNMKLKTLTLCTLLSASATVAVHAQATSDTQTVFDTQQTVNIQENKQATSVPSAQSQADDLNSQEQSYKQSADLKRTTYESQLYTLAAFKEGR